MITGHPNVDRNARYPRCARVRTRPEFDAVFARGHRGATPLLALHYLPDDLPDSASTRIGFAVSRKVDTRAVIRNRIKRVLRDHFRRHRAGFAPGAYVVVARSPAARADGHELIAAFEQARRQALRRVALPPSLASGTMPPASPSPAQAPAPSGASSQPAP